TQTVRTEQGAPFSLEAIKQGILDLESKDQVVPIQLHVKRLYAPQTGPQALWKLKKKVVIRKSTTKKRSENVGKTDRQTREEEVIPEDKELPVKKILEKVYSGYREMRRDMAYEYVEDLPPIDLNLVNSSVAPLSNSEWSLVIHALNTSAAPPIGRGSLKAKII